MAQPATPDVPLQTRIIDDKSPICIPFILSQLAAHRQRHPSGTRPFIIGLNGLQGVGKTTLVRALAETLQNREGLPTLVVSIDDFYLTHADQLALAAAHPDNALVQYRGEPGTHDIPLLTTFLTSLLSPDPSPPPIPIPSYSKPLHSGLGDRLPPSQWPVLPAPPACLLIEGWLVGFRALPPSEIEALWRDPASRTLHRHKLEHLLFVNECLRGYDVLTDALDAFVHVDAEELGFVYEWRAEQERRLREETGEGMSEEMVGRFVDGYFPAYEMYVEGVRAGVFKRGEGREGRQLRVVVGRDRGVRWKEVI
ncbi:P-loop containing nucleoside triphosphate hydrolase protein [Schizothecium vesticola]|uniref:P-loop containing nucleoside triphosphate hydrolase protein n=1 Tax=Schizothecium vesticola TaxID=314040 RepID=A0AA40ERF5_9PEZI|nr:P-loop containing nucleoside triphosphate hydrolase protein [Schizothecium vesticola]